MNDPLDAWRRNPFFVLEVGVDASRAEFERAGQKWLALLQVGGGGAARYQALGATLTRDADAVRQALSQLRDPAERVVCELWAELPASGGDIAPGGWDGADAALGWKAMPGTGSR